MLVKLYLFLFSGLLAFSCTSADDGNQFEDINLNKSEHHENMNHKPNSRVIVDDTPLIPPPKDPCTAFSESMPEPPLWLKESGFMITRIMKTCLTFDGKKGYEAQTSWMGMGVPCTGGDGYIDINGTSYDPHLISFVFANDCKIHPSDIATVKVNGNKTLKLSREAKLLAYNPFAVQYWEIPGTEDANVGYVVDLRSAQSKNVIWKNFLKNEPITVSLYGRENAWVMGDHFYEIKGTIHRMGNSTFKFKVETGKALDKEEYERVKKRCESLSPARDCQSVFK